MKRLLLGSLTLGMALGTAHAATVQVSATNTIIADIVKNVGGTRVNVNTIVPAGGDTHTFQPTTGAIRGLSGSRVLFANGAGLEPWLPRMTAAIKVPVVNLTGGVKLRSAPTGEDGGGTDPHAWWDPNNAAQYARTIQATLTRLDPAGKASYAANTAKWTAQLRQTDAYAKAQFGTLTPAQRQVVSNHDALHYFAAHYGLTIVGTVIPGLSTEREPSAREIATLVQKVRASGAKVIFTENTVNPRLAQTLAQETGIRIAPPLFTDALGPAGSGGETFVKALRFNVDTMVRALKGS